MAFEHSNTDDLSDKLPINSAGCGMFPTLDAASAGTRMGYALAEYPNDAYYAGASLQSNIDLANSQMATATRFLLKALSEGRVEAYIEDRKLDESEISYVLWEGLADELGVRFVFV